MTQEELIKFADNTFKNLLDVLKAKNSDYTNNSTEMNDALKNFKLIEHYNVATVEQGMFARISDKVSRIASFISSGTLQVKNESAEDACKDLIGYTVLLLAYMKEKKFVDVVKDEMKKIEQEDVYAKMHKDEQGAEW